MTDNLLSGPERLVKALVQGECGDPHAILGVHPLELGGAEGLVVRAFHPGAAQVSLLLGGPGEEQPRPLERVHPAGLFAGFLPGRTYPLRYQLEVTGEGGERRRLDDPYRHPPTVGDMDMHLHAEGRHYRLYERLGAHPREVDGVRGTSFAVWAPNAVRVSVVGGFNGWDGRQHMMRLMGSSGIWELFIPGLGRGEVYKYELKIGNGMLRLKTDPVAFAMELRPKSASVIWGLPEHRWGDEAWMQDRGRGDLRASPMSIYEVHLGSWMRSAEEESWLTYRELAPRLVSHAQEHGYTHLELLPVAEHAYDPSWGYQTTGYYAPTCRFGTPEDFCYLVDLCHRNGIGVLLDWVPAHFPKDDFGLRWFDGTALYEHEDPRRGEHRDWGTLIFNYGRNEVRSFLLSNALYWLDRFHIDGLRVDAVASMLYLDYSREEGQWLPNRYGGRENLEAISFLQELNTVVYEQVPPGAFTVAEESTSWPGVTAPVYLGGLGFAFKWNMGWMHDTLEYFAKEPVHRSFHHNNLTFSMLYEYSETFVMPLSHDEVVHMKGSLWGKMTGDDWQKAANLRLLLAYLYTRPGKKLLFMGGEFGQTGEWDADHSLDWHQAGEPLHAGVQQLSKDLGRLYLSQSALWAWDHEPRGFSWIDCNDSEQCVISFMRSGPSGSLVCVFNMTPVPRVGYRVGLPCGGAYRELLNSDGAAYGGSNQGNGGWLQALPQPWHGLDYSVELTIPPLAAVVLKPDDGK